MYYVRVRTLPQSVLDYIRRGQLLHAGDRAGVAISGGADSVALLRVLLATLALGTANFLHAVGLRQGVLSETMLAALQAAIRARRPLAGCVHQSDRGSQYASGDYTGLLKENGVQISMSRKGNPWDNAACESFMKTLKYEEVHRNEYRDLAEARSEIGTFLEKVYNQKRLHSALGYLPPAEFEDKLRAAAGAQP